MSSKVKQPIASRAFLKPLAFKKPLMLAVMICLVPGAAIADRTDDIINLGLTRSKDGAASQSRIDDISEQTEKVVANYHQERKNVETLKKFNERLQRTIDAQEVAKGKLEQSIEDAALIERQIVPLMLSMIDGLEKFIAADLPFKLDERAARLDRIKGYLTNANISAAERFRQVLEAYAIESDYGQSVDTFIEELDFGGVKKTVNILQVGRTGLYYLTTDGTESGYWDPESRAWTGLDSSHNEGISHAIRMTLGKVTNDLMTLPIIAPKATAGTN